MKLYRAAYLHRDSGALECGFEIQANTDEMAVTLARTEAYRRQTMDLAGLHEVTGTATNGLDLTRTVAY